jgi:ssDNA-binding Zn-finger/Zn-ribbon topoisomerase 1
MVLRDGRYGKFWSCSRWPQCDGLIGCHPGTDYPLGIPADANTRKLRVLVHDKLDPLWKQCRNRSTARRREYAWLGEALGLSEAECHVAMFDAEICKRALEVLEARKYVRRRRRRGRIVVSALDATDGR